MRCRVCGGRASHVVGCPGAAGADIRDRVQRIAQPAVAAPVSRSREMPYAPRLAQKVLGFRQWKLEGYRLRPFASQLPSYWRLGPNTAECLRAHFEPSAPASTHRAPDHACDCGLYALHEPPRPPAGSTVTGAVLAWGRIEVHEDGFRAEHAEPVILAYHDGQPPEHIEALRSIAGEFYLPVVEHGELAAAAVPLGAPIPPELHPSQPAFRPTVLSPGRARLLIGDEILLLALCAGDDGWRVGPDGQPSMPSGLDMWVAGAELAELELRGLIVRDGDRIFAVGSAPTGDFGLDAAMAVVAGLRRRRREDHVVALLAQDGALERRVWRLRERGGVTEYEQSVRGLFRTRTVRRWIAPEGGPEVLILDRVRAALLSGRADDRTAALLALMHAAGVDRRWFRDMGRRELKRRVRQITDGSWTGRAVLRAAGSRDAMSVAVNGTL